MGKRIVVVESSKIKVEVETLGRTMMCQISGRIDEDVSFAQILKMFNSAKGQFDSVSLDVGSVNEINSCGLREWILFMEKLRAIASIRFTLVSAFFVEQTNIVPNLLGDPGTKILSFSAPFFCETCQKTIMRTMTMEQVIHGNNIKIPRFLCQKCGHNLELDTIEEVYTNFINRSREKA